MAVDIDELLENERRLFNDDYDLYFLEGESKPKNIGAPFLLKHPSSKKGVLLVHGLMAAPEEVREWAGFLYSKGYSVYAPRLAGHGTSPVDLAGRRYSEWNESVERGYAILKNYCEMIVIGGFSTGAGLALLNAIQYPEKFDAVISVSAPLKFKSFSTGFVEIMHTWNIIAKSLGIESFGKVYARNHPDNPHINYFKCPIKAVAEVRALMRTVYRMLPALTIPALVIQGMNDPKVDDRSGRKLFSQMKNNIHSYSEISYHQHGIIRGDIAVKVYESVYCFLNTVYAGLAKEVK